LLLIQTRARASQVLEANDYNAAMQFIEEGLTLIQEFYRENNRAELAEQSGEITYLKNWLEEVSSKRPLSKRERLEKALTDAVNNEDYEKAAKVRDELKNLKSTE
jgi:excinuclease UvrABC helicase subunit UvrB